MPKYIGRIFDDRKPEVSSFKCTGPTYEHVRDEIQRELNMYKDPDDGVMPLHLKYSIDEEPDNDIVEVHCYGSVRKMERSKAIEEFLTSIACSEGSEQERYCRILSDLRSGKKVASDGDPVRG